jgi:hypothetical protein
MEATSSPKNSTATGTWGWDAGEEDCSVAAVRARALAYLAKREAEKLPEPVPDPYEKLPTAPTLKDHTYLYVVEVLATVKVGYATNLYVRFSNLRVDNPLEAKLAAYWEMPKRVALDVERFVHIALDARHVRGEWFDLPAKEALPHVERIRDLVSQLYGVLPPEGDITP